MESLRKKLKIAHGTPIAPNQSPTGADTVTIPSFNSNFEDKKLLDNLQSPNLVDDRRGTNAVDEYPHHHVGSLENPLSSILQANNSNNDDLNEYCLLEIFSYLSIDDMMQVKNVCRKWRQVSQQWFKRVQTLIFRDNYSKNSLWELQNKFFTDLLCSGNSWKKLISILHLCSHHIKFFGVNEGSIKDELIGNLIFPSIRKLENIVHVMIKLNYITKHPTQIFGLMSMHCKKIEKLEIGYLRKVHQDDLNKLLLNNEQLKSLFLEFIGSEDPNYHIHDEFFNYSPKTMEKIEIQYMPAHGVNQWRHFISASKNFTSLHLLEFSDINYLSDAAALAISNIKTLTHLNLIHIDHYQSPKTIDPIKNLKDLKSLNLSHNRKLSEDALINIIESCTELEELNIFGTGIWTNRGMDAIGTLRRLKFLFMHGWTSTLKCFMNFCDRLEVLVLHDVIDNVSDATKLLKKATNLRFLDLGFDEGLLENTCEIASEIASERKNNFLCFGGAHVYVFDFDDFDTLYFKYWKYPEILPTELPDDIRNMLDKFYGHSTPPVYEY